MRDTYIVCYDIMVTSEGGARRLRKTFETLRGYGDHLQESVFECSLSAQDLAELRRALREIIDHKKDQVLFISLGPTAARGDRAITAMGKPYSPVDAPCLVV